MIFIDSRFLFSPCLRIFFKVIVTYQKSLNSVVICKSETKILLDLCFLRPIIFSTIDPYLLSNCTLKILRHLTFYLEFISFL